MCSRTVSDPANRLLKRTNSEGISSVAEEKSSAVSLFRSGHMSAICARPSRERGDSQEGGNRRCLPSCAPAGKAHSPLRFSENLPPVRSEHAYGSSHPPLSRCRERSRPLEAHPVSRCRETDSRPAGTYESLRLNSSYPNIRTTSSVPSARRMAISGSGMPLNVLVLTMV